MSQHEKSMSCFVVLLPKHLPFSKIIRIFAPEYIKTVNMGYDKYTSEDKSHKDMASEPVGLYYGTSPELRDSNIIDQLLELGKEDTLWIIHFLENRLEKMSKVSDTTIIGNPLEVLDQLGEAIKSTGKTSEQLIAEYIEDKYAV